MAKCKFESVCSTFFFGMLDKTKITFRIKYCNTKFNNCARYQVIVSKGKEYVPKDLSPYDRTRAKEITSG